LFSLICFTPSGHGGGQNVESSQQAPEDNYEVLDFTQSEYATQVENDELNSEENGSSQKKPVTMPARVGQLSAKVFCSSVSPFREGIVLSSDCQISFQTIDDLTAQLVRYMLYKASLKLPIKFTDISKDVFPKYKNISR
jgi:hypothetical protein